MAEKIAKVAVSVAAYSIDRPYSYKIPVSLSEKLSEGMRVFVPFGRGNKRTEGLVLSVSDEKQEAELKYIETLIDEKPVLSKEQIKLALWMRDRFFCTVYSAVRTMLPAGMWLKDGQMKIKDKTVLRAILEISGEEAFELSNRKRLKAPQQAAILELMASLGSAVAREICYFTGASMASVRALERQGVISIEEEEAFRRPDYNPSENDEPIELNDEQQEVFDGLKCLMEKDLPEAGLLFGVTGSGKTAVYIKLIEEAIKNDKTAIVLVPEISLTPQFVSLFSAYFGDDIAVLHSSLSIGERYDEWKRIRSGLVKVVIGTRSAVFAPLEKLGLIIIDEEQEYTYKSENAPRYHARDIAKFRCVQSNALLLQGSATPAIESMYNALNGKYALFSLEKRYNEKHLPKVIISDMKQELRRGNGTTISERLYNELKSNIENGEQSILFINRRGTSNLVVCGECGYTYTCPHCSVSMKYHSANNRIMCHYCGYSGRLPEKCPECGGKLNFFGAGTQKVEAEIKELFPDIDVIRMDTDTVSPSKSHEKLLSRFKNDRIPILIGTQMVTKGLDFENVTLVGVISADQSLYVNDYRAHERTFSLITQVIGRSGRGEKEGRAVIQTYTPENDILCLASKQDYMKFYYREIEMRKVLGCPPIADIFTVTVFGQMESDVLRGCAAVRKSLENYLGHDPNVKILGPVPASVVKINDKYRYKVSVSCQNTKIIRDILSHIITEFSNDGKNRKLNAYVDINPME